MLCDAYNFINELVQQQFTVRGARVLPMTDDECPLCLEPLVGLPTVTFPCCQLVTHRACLGENILQGPCPQCRTRPQQRAAVAESRRRIQHMLRGREDLALDGIRTPPIWCMFACCAELSYGRLPPMMPEWPQVAPADERLMVQCQCAYTSCSPPFTAFPTYFRFLDNAQPSFIALPHPAYTVLNRAAGFIGRGNRAYQTAMSL